MRKFIKSRVSLSALASALAFGTGAAEAAGTSVATGSGGQAISQSGFNDFEQTILYWVNGPLGVGLAVTSLVVGGSTGIVQSNPMPAIAGIALAAIFAFAPGVIASLVTGGALIG